MRKRTLGAMLGFALAAGGAFGQIQANEQTLDARVAQELDLRDFTIQALAIPAEAGESFQITLDLGGEHRTIVLDHWSYRSPGAKAFIDDGTGQLKQIELGIPKTYRGYDAHGPGIAAAGSLLDSGLTLTIVDLDADEAWTVQPLRDAVPDADRSLHVVYSNDDVIMLEQFRCGGAIPPNGGQIDQIPVDGTGASRSLLVCEVAFDADYQFFQQNGSSEQNTITDIDNVMAGVALSYETYIGVTFTTTHYIVRTTSQSNPYTSNNPNTLLTQFRNWWNSNAQGVHRDIAHLMTGRNMGGVIGIAYLSVVCNIPSAYGVSRSRFTNNMNRRVALTAHEIGHNFSAPHCDNNAPCHIMCSGLGGCNGLGNPPRFGPYSIGIMVPYAQSRWCLDEQGDDTLEPPILETFPTTTLDPELWDINNGGVINADGQNEPSPPYSLNLSATASVQTLDIDMSNTVEQPYFTLFTQHNGVETGKTLKVRYFDFISGWTDLATYTSDGENRDYFSWSIVPIPVTGWHDAFKVLIAAQGADSSDKWYADDMYIGSFRGLEIPFLEDIPTSTLRNYVWKSTSNATSSTGGVNPPSPPNSLRIVADGSAQTHNYLMADAPFGSHASFYVQHRGVENGKQLVAEYFDIFGNWTVLNTFTSNGVDQNSFVFFQQELGFGAHHDNFALRFRALGADSSDAWYIDNVFVGPQLDAPDDDCYADCNGDGEINSLDFICFLNLYTAGDPLADCNGDGQVNSLDFICFLNAYNEGCP